MFNAITPEYDLMNRVMTFGRDRAWRRLLVRQVAVEPGERVLDLATGTGDMAFEIQRQQPSAEVYAGDFALKMMQHAQSRAGADRVHWVACDAMSLPFRDESFDAVTCGFLLRNVADRSTAMGEIWRVLKPGGRFASLDTMPPSGPAKPFVWLACRLGVPMLARVLSKRAGAYQYLGDSTLGFATPEKLMAELIEAGFSEPTARSLWLRSIAIVAARKPT